MFIILIQLFQYFALCCISNLFWFANCLLLKMNKNCNKLKLQNIFKVKKIFKVKYATTEKERIKKETSDNDYHLFLIYFFYHELKKKKKL